MSCRTVSIDVDIEVFDDRDIVDEAIARRLVLKILAKSRGKEKANAPDARLLAVDAMQHLVCGRVERARTALHAAIAAYVPPELIAAMDAIGERRAADAIIEIDRFIDPSLAATAKSLPPKPQPSATGAPA